MVVNSTYDFDEYPTLARPEIMSAVVNVNDGMELGTAGAREDAKQILFAHVFPCGSITHIDVTDIIAGRVTVFSDAESAIVRDLNWFDICLD